MFSFHFPCLGLSWLFLILVLPSHCSSCSHCSALDWNENYSFKTKTMIYQFIVSWDNSMWRTSSLKTNQHDGEYCWCCLSWLTVVIEAFSFVTAAAAVVDDLLSFVRIFVIKYISDVYPDRQWPKRCESNKDENKSSSVNNVQDFNYIYSFTFAFRIWIWSKTTQIF